MKSNLSHLLTAHAQDDLEEAAAEIATRQERDRKKMMQEVDRNLAQYAIKGEGLR